MDISLAIQEFGFDCKVRKLSPKTIENYQKQMQYLFHFLVTELGIDQVEDVRSDHIKQFLAMMDGKGRKPQYINDLLKVYKTFFNYCQREGYVKTSPAASVRNMKQPKTVILNSPEYKEMMQLRRETPSFSIVLREIKKKEGKKSYRNLTYENMQTFIENYETDDGVRTDRLKEYETVKALSRVQSGPYAYVKAWFLKQYGDAYNPEEAAA